MALNSKFKAAEFMLILQIAYRYVLAMKFFKVRIKSLNRLLVIGYIYLLQNLQGLIVEVSAFDLLKYKLENKSQYFL